MLWLGRLIGRLPVDTRRAGERENENPENQPLIAKMLRQRRLMIERFRRIWVRDYLLALGADKFQRKGAPPTVEKGLVVLLREKKIGGKEQWRLARVVETKEGRDGLIRRVTVKTKDGVLNRHISDLALLEGAPTLAQQKGNPEKERES